MFGRKAHADVHRSASKVIDTKKEPITRLRHLRVVIESWQSSELKVYFTENYSHIYYIFYEVLTNVEAELKHRVNKSHRDDLDVVLFIFEKILTLLPELVHKRWQFNSIGSLMKKLLHAGNSAKIRKHGVRLFLIWYQILGENASSECHQTFSGLVPHLSTVRHTVQGVPSSPDVRVQIPEVQPILPSAESKIDGRPDAPTKWLLEVLLGFIVSEVPKVEWRNPTMHEHCFLFLFNKFKEHYLLRIFPSFDLSRSIYSADVHLPDRRSLDSALIPPLQLACQEVVVHWLSRYTLTVQAQLDSTLVATSRQIGYETLDGSETLRASQKNLWTELEEPRSCSITQSRTSVELYSDQVPPGIDHSVSVDTPSSDGQASHLNGLWTDRINDEFSGKYSVMDNTITSTELEKKLVRAVLYSSRDNVNIVHEILRQAFLLPFDRASVIRRAISVYRHWFMSDESQLRSGLQRVFQVFIVNSANMFLLQPSQGSSLRQGQVDLCKRTLNIYRELVMKHRMDSSTWNQLVQVLMTVTESVMSDKSAGDQGVSSQLAAPLFQTLIITWIKANLNVYISESLWDKFLSVLCSLTAWPELISEWSKTMELLTKVLSRQLYNLDLNDLPLERQKKKRGGRAQVRSRPSRPSHLGLMETSAQEMQRSASGDLSPMSRSIIIGSLGGEGQLVRSNSDTSLALTGVDRKGVTYSSEAGELAVKQAETPSMNGMYFSASEDLDSDSLSSNRLAKHPDSSTGTEDQDEVSITASIGLTDTASVASVDSSPAAFQYPDLASDASSADNRPYVGSKSVSRSPSPARTESSDGHDGGDEEEPLHEQAETARLDGLGQDPARSGSCVLGGGAVVGWTRESAVALWRRMLGCLGDPNLMADPRTHAQFFSYLVRLTKVFQSVRENMSVTADNLTSPSPPDLVPPSDVVLPWVFAAIQLPSRYKPGKLLALQLLCLLTIRRHDIPPQPEHLSRFFLVLHRGLVHADVESTRTLIEHCSPSCFSSLLPGIFLMALDFVHAIDVVTSSTELDQMPRLEAVALLGSMLCFKHFPLVQVSPTELEVTITSCSDLRNRIVSLLLRAAKKEPAEQARRVAISALGIFLHQELSSANFNNHTREAISLLTATLKFKNKQIAQVAADMLSFLQEHIPVMLHCAPEQPLRILEAVLQALGVLMSTIESSVAHTNLMLSILYCLLDWCIYLPIEQLCHVESESSGGNLMSSCLLLRIFKVLVQLRSTQDSEGSKSINVCAGAILSHLLHHLRHFPMACGAAQLHSSVNEMDDLVVNDSPQNDSPQNDSSQNDSSQNDSSQNDSSQNDSPQNDSSQNDSPQNDSPQNDLLQNCDGNALYFCCQDNLISLVEIPVQNDLSDLVAGDVCRSDMLTRVIIRSANGKFCWDNVLLYGLPPCRAGSRLVDCQPMPEWIAELDQLCSKFQESDGSEVENGEFERGDKESGDKESDGQNVEVRAEDAPRTTLKVPSYQPGSDALGNLLDFITESSPECTMSPDYSLNQASKELFLCIPEATRQFASEALQSHSVELSQCAADKAPVTPGTRQVSAEANGHQPELDNAFATVDLKLRNVRKVVHDPFRVSKIYLHMLGLMQWSQRNKFDLLRNGEKLQRDLKHLDSARPRHTYKVAVIYVGFGQEDKHSILSNACGSAAFEQFVAGLGWEVDLSLHRGFMGGLQANESTGKTAPYFASSTVELMWHVSTRMPSESSEDHHRKLRHLGNDEVMVVWSEHGREYRRGIISTEFGDVIIVIYPMPSGLLRVQVLQKPEVPKFGPLFDGAIVTPKLLPSLVRASVVNASRVICSLKPYYRTSFEERTASLLSIRKNHVLPCCFEDFAAHLFSPKLSDESLMEVARVEEDYVPAMTPKDDFLTPGPFQRKMSAVRSRTSSKSRNASESSGSDEKPPKKPSYIIKDNI